MRIKIMSVIENFCYLSCFLSMMIGLTIPALMTPRNMPIYDEDLLLLTSKMLIVGVSLIGMTVFLIILMIFINSDSLSAFGKIWIEKPHKSVSVVLGINVVLLAIAFFKHGIFQLMGIIELPAIALCYSNFDALKYAFQFDVAQIDLTGINNSFESERLLAKRIQEQYPESTEYIVDKYKV